MSEKIHDERRNEEANSGDEYEYEEGRRSEDVRTYDRETLGAEEEAERLLAGNEKQGRRDGEKSDSRQRRRKDGPRRKKGELIYQLEEGGRRSSEESSINSSEDDMRRLAETQARQKKKTSRATHVVRVIAILAIFSAAFAAFVYGAYRASADEHETSSTTTTTTTSSSKASYVAQTLSNGTHTFAPTTLLISLDGFRADFLARNLTPTLNAFIESGVSPKYMTPSFPSLTFPNHYTLVTGLYPESHGVVGNTFWDPTMLKEFDYGDGEGSMQPEWWRAEPLWMKAERSGVRSAVHMWPGSEAVEVMAPFYVDEFDGHEKLERKVERILGWLDLPGELDEAFDKAAPRPQFIAAYVPNVDADGHKYGPNSTYIRSTIREVDGMLKAVFDGVEERNLSGIVNVVVVSDHGMATTSIDRLIQLDDLVDTGVIEHTDGWPLYGLRPYDSSPANLETLYDQLLAKSKLPEYEHAFDVYLRDKNMPVRYHFSQNERIAPLWIVPKAGWAIVTKEEFDIPEAKSKGIDYLPHGLHGYDDQHPLMRAIFVARGPAFPHEPGSRVPVFQNVEVYNIVCDSLGLEPAANNGTLRLPLRTEGKHDFMKEPMETPDDPGKDEVKVVPNLNQGLADNDKHEVEEVENLNAGLPDRPTIQTAAPPEVEGKPAHGADAPKRPVVHDGEEDEGPTEAESWRQWWEWMKSRVESIKWWTKEHFGKNGTVNGTQDGA